MTHCREEQRDALLARLDVLRLLRDFRHPKHIAMDVESVESRCLRIQLFSEDHHPMTERTVHAGYESVAHHDVVSPQRLERRQRLIPCGGVIHHGSWVVDS